MMRLQAALANRGVAIVSTPEYSSVVLGTMVLGGLAGAGGPGQNKWRVCSRADGAIERQCLLLPIA